jgi:hypothetical protein
MFGSLQEQIESTEGARPKPMDMLVRYAGIAVLAVVVFGGLCALILVLE